MGRYHCALPGLCRSTTTSGPRHVHPLATAACLCDARLGMFTGLPWMLLLEGRPLCCVFPRRAGSLGKCKDVVFDCDGLAPCSSPAGWHGLLLLLVASVLGHNSAQVPGSELETRVVQMKPVLARLHLSCSLRAGLSRRKVLVEGMDTSM